MDTKLTHNYKFCCFVAYYRHDLIQANILFVGKNKNKIYFIQRRI